MLGIVVSLPWELKSLTPQPIPAGACRQIADDTLVALSGIGATRAHEVSALLVSRGATALLSWGCAAALDVHLKAGSVVLPERVIETTGESLAVDVEWHRRLYQTLSADYRVSKDPLVESDAIVMTPEAKRSLAQRTHAGATDMESVALAMVADTCSLPFVVVRVIIDSASTQMPENVMQALDHGGRIKAGSFLARACLRPGDGIALVKLGLQFSRARRTLNKASGLVLDASRTYLSGLSVAVTPAGRL